MLRLGCKYMGRREEQQGRPCELPREEKGGTLMVQNDKKAQQTLSAAADLFRNSVTAWASHLTQVQS